MRITNIYAKPVLTVSGGQLGRVNLWTDYDFPLEVGLSDFSVDSYIRITDPRSVHWDYEYNIEYDMVIEYDDFGVTDEYVKRFSLGARHLDGFVMEVDGRRVNNGDTLLLDAFDTVDFELKYMWRRPFNINEVDISSGVYLYIEHALPYQMTHVQNTVIGRFAYENYYYQNPGFLVIIAKNADTIDTRFILYLTPNSNTISLGLKEDVELTIYPNPTLDILTIKAGIVKDHLSIYDMAGHVVLSKKLTSSPGETVEVDVSALKPGIYLIQVGVWYSRFTKE